MNITALLLSRVQFGFTIGFHIIFPTLNLGLAVFLAMMEAAWLKTQNPLYLQICKFWSKVFALTFGMGVVSGIVLAYELGTNFSQFIKVVGSVLGPLFAYEVLSAFFLEAGFLGVMLFGWDKVGPRLHYLATLMVAVGTTISAFWIMSANSWMQTPAGAHLEAGSYVVDSWWAVVFNPAFIPRFIHMLMASYITSCFVIAGISAWYLIKQQHIQFAQRCFSFALSCALILTPLQIVLGDVVGIKVHQYQPLKTAAMEGLWNTRQGAPLVLFAIPDLKQETNRYALEIPNGASLLNTHHLHGELLGLKSVQAADRPIIPTVFFAFRIMVGIGFLLLAIAGIGIWLKAKQHLYDKRWFLRLCVAVAPLGFVSTIAGWLVAETGRQPWIVYGLMRTAEGASIIPVQQVWISLLMFISVYGVIFTAYLYYLFHVIRSGPISQDAKLTTPADEIPKLFTYMSIDNIREGGK